MNNPTPVFTFLCYNPNFHFQAVQEVERMRLNGAEASMIAYGDEYDTEWIRPLANAPDRFMAVDFDNINYGEINVWMLNATNPDAIGEAPVTTTAFGTTDFTTTAMENITTTVETNTTTIEANATTLEPTVIPNPTQPTTTPVPVCKETDVVFVFEISCFSSPNRFFNSSVQPILTSFAEKINPCVSVSTAYVEYGSWADITKNYHDFHNSSEALSYMKNYTVVGNKGSRSNADEAFNRVNYNILRDAQARSLNNPTVVYTFLCRTPSNQNRGIQAAENMKLNGAISSVLAYGNEYSANSVRILANSPDHFLRINDTSSNAGEVADWMLAIFNPPVVTLPPGTQSTAPTTTSGNATTSDGNSTTPLPDATSPTTDSPYCSVMDLVFVIDRKYFSQSVYNKTIDPLFDMLSNDLSECVDLRVSIVEYATFSNIRFYLDTYTPTTELLPALKDYQPAGYLGAESSLGSALDRVENEVLVKQRGRRDVYGNVVIFLGNNPEDQSYAIDSAESIKLLNNTVVTVVGYGENYDEEQVRILASGPDNFFPVSDQEVIEDYLFYALTALDQQATTTATTPAEEGCCDVDVAVVIDRSYFNANRFVAEGRPVVADFLNTQLPACASIRLAVVEYGTWVSFTKELDDSDSSESSRAFISDFVPSINVGTNSNLGKAIEAVNVQVVVPFKGRRKQTPLLTILMVGSNPAKLGDAINEAERLKGDETTITVFGFGFNYNTDDLRILASDKTFFYDTTVGGELPDAFNLVEHICNYTESASTTTAITASTTVTETGSSTTATTGSSTTVTEGSSTTAIPGSSTTVTAGSSTTVEATTKVDNVD